MKSYKPTTEEILEVAAQKILRARVKSGECDGVVYGETFSDRHIREIKAELIQTSELQFKNRRTLARIFCTLRRRK